MRQNFETHEDRLQETTSYLSSRQLCNAKIDLKMSLEFNRLAPEWN
jgi:hypothetical protein